MQNKKFIAGILGTVVSLAAALGTGAEPKRISLPEANLDVRLNPDTGLVSEIISTRPTPLKAVGQMEVYCVINNRKIVFDKAIRYEEKNDQYIYRLESSAKPAPPLTVEIIYSAANPEYFQERVSFTATTAISKPVKLGIRHSWDPAGWEKLLGGTRPVRAVDASAPTCYSYGKAVNDQNLTRLDQYQSATLPLFIATRADRFFLTGDLCVDTFMTLCPNMPENSFPSVQRNPLSLKKGQKLSMTLVFRSFDDRHLLRDVWRWFLNRLYTNYASLRPYLLKVPDSPRVMGSGNWCSFTYYKEAREKRMPSGSHIWWSMWHDQIREHYPVSGEWWVNIPWAKGKMTAERQKKELERIQNMGHHPYLYFRNLVNTESLANGDIPKDWIKKNEDGDYERYGTGRGIGWNMPQSVTDATGYKRVQWGFLNFSNPAMREWYLDSVKKCLEFYKPYGIAMDFSWKSNELGVQVLQGQIVDYIRKNHPGMKIAINDASGSPGQLLADVVLIENGFLGGKTGYDYETAKALRTNFIALERFNLFENVMRHLLEGKKTWLSPFAVSDAKHFLDYSLTAGRLSPNDFDSCKNAAHLRAGLRNLALGAGWGYIEECPNHQLVSDFAGEINGLPPLTDSFHVRIDGTSDKKGRIYAAAWADEGRLRIAVFNDETSPVSPTVEVSLPKAWHTRSSLKQGQAWNISAYGKKSPAIPNVNVKDGVFILKTGAIEPFSLQTYSLDYKDQPQK